MSEGDIGREELRELTSAWWLMMLLGVVSVAAGLVVLAKPSHGLATLAVVFGVFVLNPPDPSPGSRGARDRVAARSVVRGGRSGSAGPGVRAQVPWVESRCGADRARGRHRDRVQPAREVRHARCARRDLPDPQWRGDGRTWLGHARAAPSSGERHAQRGPRASLHRPNEHHGCPDQSSVASTSRSRRGAWSTRRNGSPRGSAAT